jgi:hypothetical protein
MCWQCGIGYTDFKHQRCLSLLKEEDDYLLKLSSQGINTLQLFRVFVKALRTHDEDKKKELSYFLDTEPDGILRYCKQEPKTKSIEWRSKWNDKR